MWVEPESISSRISTTASGIASAGSSGNATRQSVKFHSVNFQSCNFQSCKFSYPHIVCCAMLYGAETNVTGSQSSTVAVKGDVVNFTCEILFHGNTNPSLSWDTNPECGPKILPVRGQTVHRTTISFEDGKVRVKIPDGPATVFCTCHVYDSPQLYFWRSTVITVSCEYER